MRFFTQGEDELGSETALTNSIRAIALQMEKRYQESMQMAMPD
jgi:hypothetical protein